ncbi:MAG: hypothetical protein GEU91_03590 [Rhizobiales bacterium]|nr:hypothetical protein [Hyphomicrobiales bacterium]
MGFLFSVLSYFACLCATVILITASVAYIFPAPAVPHSNAVEVNAQKHTKAQRSARAVARQSAGQAAEAR